MLVKEIMSTDLITIKPSSTIHMAAAKMIKHGISGLIASDNGYDLSGIITKTDLLKAFVDGKKAGTPVDNIMRKKVYVVDAKDTLEDAAEIMTKKKVKRLPVVHKGRCVGIVTATDLIRYEDHMMDKLAVLYVVEKSKLQAG